MKTSKNSYNFDRKLEKINDEYLLVLKKNKKHQLYLDSEIITYPFKKEVNQLVDICNKQEDSVDELTKYIRNTPKLNEFEGFYNYCQKLSKPFQQVTPKKNEIVLKRIRKKSIRIENKKSSYKPLIEKIKKDYILWEKVYSIKKCYKKCRVQENILSYSHRMSGWNDRPHLLTKDFSFKFSTNFGFGNSSYFYITLKFKGIYITPFTDWINYDFVQLSEVKRYSKSFGKQVPLNIFNGENERRYKPVIDNYDWFEAMGYVKESFNLYQKNEKKFIEKYIINECEKMIKGLERIVNNTKIYLIDENQKRYNFDIKGHYLMEFKGERISGSLEFINRILEYKSILPINDFIERIESFNETLKPILKNEIELILSELKELNTEFIEIERELDSVKDEFKEYKKEIRKIKREISKSDKIKLYLVDEEQVIKKIKKTNPEYEKFIKTYEKVEHKHKILNEKIKNLNRIRKNIKDYHENIENYFSN